MKLTTDDYIIELSQIHSFEKEHYNYEEYKLKYRVYDSILNSLEEIYLDLTEPFLVYEEPESSYWREKHQQWRNYGSHENPFYNDLIYCNNKFYSFLFPIHVNRSTQDFNLWFALKLRQLNKNLFEVDGFLRYHLIEEFNSDSIDFNDFIRLVVRQYSDDLFSPRLTVTIKEWLNYQDKQTDPKKAMVKKALKTIDGNFLSFQLAKANPVNKKFLDNRISSWTELKEELVLTLFMHRSSTAKQLKAIFQNTAILKDQRVIWNGANIELKWFLEYLIEQKGVVEDPGKAKWYLATKCFVNKEGNDFTIEQLSKANGKNLKRKNLLIQTLDKFFDKP